MQMFTAKEKKNLTSVLSKAADTEAALCLEELHGLLFGIAITPEPIMPSEWLPLVFRDESQHDADEEIKICIDHLLEVHNRMINAGSKGKLVFPFDYEKLTKSKYAPVESWTHGLFLGLSLRPHIWRISKEHENIDSKEISADIRNMMDCRDIVTTIALPEEREGVYEPIPGLPAKSPAEVEEMLYFMLPAAIEGLRQHSVKLRKENPAMKPPTKKTVCNESGTADSSKKNKKAGKN